MTQIFSWNKFINIKEFPVFLKNPSVFFLSYLSTFIHNLLYTSHIITFPASDMWFKYHALWDIGNPSWLGAGWSGGEERGVSSIRYPPSHWVLRCLVWKPRGYRGYFITTRKPPFDLLINDLTWQSVILSNHFIITFFFFWKLDLRRENVINLWIFHYYYGDRR